MNEYRLPFAIIQEVVVGKFKLLLLLAAVAGIITFFVLRKRGKRDHNDDERRRIAANTAAEPTAPIQVAGKEFSYTFDQDPAGEMPPHSHSALTGGDPRPEWDVQR